MGAGARGGGEWVNRFPLCQTTYGFRWGPLLVERCMSDKRAGIVVTVSGATHYVHIRVSPGGRALSVDGPHLIPVGLGEE